MKRLFNQQGYALLIVLLIIVLFMGISATFMAGSMNYATQEQKVDSSNKSIAVAEMGVQYLAVDFEEELKDARKTVSAKAEELLAEFKICIKNSEAECDTAEKREDRESQINSELRALYLALIEEKVHQYNLSKVAKEPFSQVKYELESAALKETGNPNEVQVEMMVNGESADSSNTLLTTLLIDIPEDFIVKNESQHEPIIIDQTNSDVSYEEIFALQKPALSCAALMNSLAGQPADEKISCFALVNADMRSFSDQLSAAGLNPQNFTVYTEDFISNFCRENHCRNIDFGGLNIVADQAVVDVNNHMRYFSNFKLIVDGQLSTGNHLEDLGLEGGRQTIILKELIVGNHLREIENTNLLILGNTSSDPADLQIGNKVEIGQNSNMCIDIDRVKSAHWKTIASKIDFIGNGSLTYYSASPGVTFPISGEHIIKAASYESFLESCGLVMEHTESIEVAVPVLIDTDFEFEVDYTNQ